ncbi:hypothetical protein OSB04_018985 [Centaurea solstitialis]|uniref:Integrase catalytic domain-containing protein n=1 Tax=Centaurea solstitialis TaxID=347529 RepID=A0AA38W2E9_9ASTR|nr:hypothetical protein OSB04_018985 [Centaurea solstitialis]
MNIQRSSTPLIFTNVAFDDYIDSFSPSMKKTLIPRKFMSQSQMGVFRFGQPETQEDCAFVCIVKPLERKLSSEALEFYPKNESKCSSDIPESSNTKSLCWEPSLNDSNTLRNLGGLVLIDRDLLTSDSDNEEFLDRESDTESEICSEVSMPEKIKEGVNQQRHKNNFKKESRIGQKSCNEKPNPRKGSNNHFSVPFFENIPRVSTWVVDSGCSRHMTGTLELLTSYIKQEGSFVACWGNQKGRIKGYGMIFKGEVRMNQVSCVDGLKHNLISVSQLCDNGMDVLFKMKFCVMYKADTLVEVMRANRRGDLYPMCFDTSEAKEEICLISSVKSEKAWLWHIRFCHLNFHTLDKLVRLKLVKGLPNIKFEKEHLCAACEMGKLRRSSHKTKSDPSYDKPLQMLHVDLCGPIAVQSLGGKKYIMVLVDEFSRKSSRSDNGTEFKNAAVEEYLASVGITHNFLAPRTPQQNGVVERKNRTLVEAARTMLNASGLSLTFWAEAVSAACFTQNRSLVVKRFEKTPYQLLHNKRPNVKFFHVFGCKCYVLNDREPIGKFNPKGDDVIFLGYSWDSAAYRVYVLRSQILVVSTNVRFDDNFQVTQDKFTEELKIQAEKSPNATTLEDLEQLFHEWYEDEPDPDRASAENVRASVENLQEIETSNGYG